MESIGRQNIDRGFSTVNPEKVSTILLYSPDMDFCMSFRFLFQDQYNLITITDPKLLLQTAREFNPSLVIVDSASTELMKRRFEMMKQENPNVRIMLLYVVPFGDRRVSRYIPQSVDAAFSKPIDLTEVTTSIDELMAHCH